MKKRQKVIRIAGFTFILLIALTAFLYYSPFRNLIFFYSQVTKERAGSFTDLQPAAQKGASYVGSAKCAECHQDLYDIQHASMHVKMIQDVRKDTAAIVVDFSTLPEDADFKLEEVIYTIGGKFKQRYMIRFDKDGEENYRVGNYE
jgi:hypothetical protein